MATQITATLPTLDFPREVDYPTQEDWVAFSTAAELNLGILGGDWSTQMQLWKTQANAMSTELNTNANIAQGLANYQGDWTSKGYTLGQTVSVGEVYYICKLTHSTGQNPTDVSSLYWNLALSNWNLKVDTNMSGYTSKTTPVDADLIPLSDSVATFGIKKLTWANIKATIISSFGEMISTLTAKTTPVDADIFTISDSAATNASKKLYWANIKATLKTYFDTLYNNFTENDLRVKTALNASGTAPIYACRAWVNVNGSGTVAIKANGNVSSITDTGVGSYKVNLITAMQDSNYSVVGTSSNEVNSAATGFIIVNILNASSFMAYATNHGGVGFDDTFSIAVFR